MLRKSKMARTRRRRKKRKEMKNLTSLMIEDDKSMLVTYEDALSDSFQRVTLFPCAEGQFYWDR